ncbi:hypothetical protein [Arthrobacter rhombi]|uniref:hypothetical protein n=1 Tax=Arthrobacter rhombi TaxID=71253 RepID=UPI003FD3CDF9
MKKEALAAALAVAALSLSGCAGGTSAPADTERPANSAPSAHESAPAPADPLEAAAQAANVDGLEVTKSSAKGKVIVAQFPVADHMTKRMIVLDAQDDTVKILEAIKENVSEYTEIYVQGSFATTDDYGNESNPLVVNASYANETVEKINFDGLDSSRVWTIRDGGKIDSSLQG